MIRGVGVLGFVMVTGCGSVPVPTGPAAVEGVIVERDRTTSFEKERPTIWVKSDLEEECGVIYVIARDTNLFARGSDGKVVGMAIDAFQVGATVRVWSDLVLRSCPGQSTAEAVELVEPSDRL